MSSNCFLRREGSMLVLVSVVMILFMVCAAFCVDIAYMHMVKSELRTAVDASSRAGTETLIRTQDEATAIAAAIQIAEANSVAGNGLTLELSDVSVGEAEPLENGRFEFSPGGDQLNAVSVVGARSASSPDGDVGLFFGSVFGVNGFSPTLDSVSAGSVRDIALVLDRSGSMNARLAGGTRLTALIDAVNAFIQEIESSSPNSNISLTTYSTRSQRDIPLTENFGAVSAQVNSLRARGLTNIFQGIRQGSDSLQQDGNRRRFADRTIVVMTDGNFNAGGNPTPSARLAAGRDHTIHTITFSNGANQAIMRQVADIGGGIHIHADSAGDLTEAFQEIARTLSVVIID